jgi:diguanylate cyclase (GGDEF)-like protein
MGAWREPPRSATGQDMPADVYVSLVDSLFRDSRSMLIGAVAVVMAVLLTAVKTGEPLLFVCALAIAAVGLVRVLGVRAYDRAKVTTAEAARRWEFGYVVGTSAHVALMGMSCVVAFVYTSDPFAHLVCVVSTIANLIGIAGRNFGSSRLVLMQILCACPLITAALWSTRDPYYGIYGVLLVAFFISVKTISDRLRRTLLDAVIATQDVRLLANRFDTALNNMPHGLCMFDAERRLVVANRRLAQLLSVPPELVRPGASARELLSECARAGMVLTARPERFVADFERRLAGRVAGQLMAEIEGGRTLALTFQAMANGGSVVLVEDITERKNAQAKINYLARYDALTGLPNRMFFRDHMERALAVTRRGGRFAVLFVDLDQFKQVNDTLGHPRGDELLCAVAERLRGIVRESDVVARFGGDEFVVLQYPVTRPDEAAALARRVVDELSVPYEIESHQVVIGASIGIAMAPADGADADLLLKNADMALYRAKSNGRAGWSFFEPEMDVKAQARRSLELDLRKALANDAFEIYYQPVVNLHTRRISTCEALLRWPDPERGMVSPGEFISVAEEMGLIVEIGRWVLRRACLECMKWPNDVRVAVNLSSIQFRRSNVMGAVRGALAASGLSASRLEIEITESVLLQDTDATRVTLHQLRDLGVRISLDDFGTGYSSLSYLHSFPLHKVKIDRSFLDGIETSERSLSLLRGVARLSAELGMTVVVEGVETDAQLALIARESSIDEAQGFLFSRPIPGRSILDMLRARPSAMEKVA